MDEVSQLCWRVAQLPSPHPGWVVLGQAGLGRRWEGRWQAPAGSGDPRAHLLSDEARALRQPVLTRDRRRSAQPAGARGQPFLRAPFSFGHALRRRCAVPVASPRASTRRHRGQPGPSLPWICLRVSPPSVPYTIQASDLELRTTSRALGFSRSLFVLCASS